MSNPTYDARIASDSPRARDCAAAARRSSAAFVPEDEFADEHDVDSCLGGDDLGEVWAQRSLRGGTAERPMLRGRRSSDS